MQRHINQDALPVVEHCQHRDKDLLRSPQYTDTTGDNQSTTNYTESHFLISLGGNDNKDSKEIFIYAMGKLREISIRP